MKQLPTNTAIKKEDFNDLKFLDVANIYDVKFLNSILNNYKYKSNGLFKILLEAIKYYYTPQSWHKVIVDNVEYNKYKT